MDDVVQHLVQADDDTDLGLMKMLGGADVRTSLVDEAEAPAAPRDRLAGPFAHVIVDEAQELTDAQWRMLLRRCPSRSFTIVGDRAQARHGFTGSWRDRLGAVGLREVGISSLRVNYRTPEEIMTEAEPVIRAALPDANVPVSVRRSGIPVHRGTIAERDGVVERWLAEHQEGVACVIGDPSFAERPRVRSLTPSHAKGLEFDLVVLVDPDALGDGIEGAVDRYVSMTRANGRLVILDDR
jgi:superfamily I DNA/RNA helicase